MSLVFIKGLTAHNSPDYSSDCAVVLRWIHCLVSTVLQDRRPGIVITTAPRKHQGAFNSSFSPSLSRLYHVNISVSCLQLDNFHWMIYPELVTRNVASGGIRMELPWLCQSWRLSRQVCHSESTNSNSTKT